MIASTTQPPSEAEQLNQWIYQTLRPFLKGKVLEISSGEGNMSALFVQDSFALRLSDPDGSCRDALKKRFEGEPMIKGVHRLDLSDPAFELVYYNFFEKFDTLILVNTPEKNGKDSDWINNAKKILKERGRLILLLPTYIALYDESEEGLKEWRHSNKYNIRNWLGKKSELLKAQFFAMAEITQPLADSYHQQVPFFQVTADTSSHPTGLYVIVVARVIKDARSINKTK